MPSFDQFERLVRSGLANPSSIMSCSLAMANLPDNERPTFARRRNQSELQAWLLRARGSLMSFLPDDHSVSTSDNNLEGKDLIGNQTGTLVELKSPGGRTDANAGASTIAWALGDPTKTLSTLMTSTMKSRRAIWLDHSKSEAERKADIDRSKAQLISELRDYFLAFLKVGQPVPSQMRHFAYCVSVGLTKLSEIRASLKSDSLSLPLLLEAHWDQGLQQYEQAFLQDEQVVTSSISGEKESNRLTVTIEGVETGRKCRLYPHYKNSFRHGAESIPAMFWVKTPCFHIWIDP